MQSYLRCAPPPQPPRAAYLVKRQAPAVKEKLAPGVKAEFGKFGESLSAVKDKLDQAARNDLFVVDHVAAAKDRCARHVAFV